MADLEAELDDPSGEWEETDPAEAMVQGPPAANSESTQQARRTDNPPEHPGVSVEAPQPAQPQSQRDRSGNMEIAEASDDSSVEARILTSPENFSNLHINDEPPSPSDSESPAQHTSNATVAPVDIISRKPVPGAAIATSSRLAQPNSHLERTTTRTPSPNGLSSSVGDALGGVEGPMTPRNDVGPFIFDGSAGRGAEALATLNLASAADTPSPATPQPA